MVQQGTNHHTAGYKVSLTHGVSAAFLFDRGASVGFSCLSGGVASGFCSAPLLGSLET
jgi:hypothetical protein